MCALRACGAVAICDCFSTCVLRVSCPVSPKGSHEACSFLRTTEITYFRLTYFSVLRTA